jgi:hypothetical protein
MQEGEDDVDIPAADTTTPVGQQGQQDSITRDQAYMPNSQVNSFLAVHTYSSQNWMLQNHNHSLFIFRNMSEEPDKCEGTSNKFAPGGRSDNSHFVPRGNKFRPAFPTTRLEL